MGQILSTPLKLSQVLVTYYRGFFHYLWGDGRNQPYGIGLQSTFRPLHPQPSDTPSQSLFKRHARIHLYTLTSNFYLYNKPHYRKGTYREDLVDVRAV